MLILDPATKSRLSNAIKLVRASISLASSAGKDAWQFSIQISEMYRYGLTDGELRWLVVSGFVQHLQETTTLTDTRRTFEVVGQLYFTDRSCFVASESAPSRKSLAQLDGEQLESLERVSQTNGTNGKVSKPFRLKPRWDPAQRKLWVGQSLVRVFRWRAPNQELVLTVFQEEDWPEKIFDPIPASHPKCPKRRLHDTIKCLNRGQKKKLIQFRGDGTSQGVLWELVLDSQARSSGTSVPTNP